jgi:hypothetical protein
VSNIVSSILGNLVTIPIVALIFYIIGWLTRRGKLLLFFTGQSRLSPRKNPFTIYLSSVERPPSPGRHYSIWEVTEARNLQNLFESFIPGPTGNAGLFRAFKIIGWDCEIVPATPENDIDILSSSCLVVGSPMFNEAAEKFQQLLSSPVRFEASGDRLSAYRLIVPQERPIDDEMRGIIVRIRQGGKSFFYAAGRTEYSTAGALYILRRKWYELYKQFGLEKPFLVQIQAKHDYRLSFEISRSELPIGQ